ncbi:MAG: hypothetical protein ACI9H6_000648 [Patiriisocius sp.]|jgi:uncharacterized protein Usg
MQDASTMSETELMLDGYGLTTAKLIYRMPDHQSVLNTFTWQQYDLAPGHPELHGFIEFWQKNIDGPLHSVIYAHRKLIAASEWRNAVYWGEVTSDDLQLKLH